MNTTLSSMQWNDSVQIFAKHAFLFIWTRELEFPKVHGLIVYDYYLAFEETKIVQPLLLITNPRFEDYNSILSLPSLFYESMIEIKPNSPAEELRSMIPNYCYRIVHCKRLDNCCCHRRRPATKYYARNYPPKCNCSTPSTQGALLGTVIGIKIHLLLGKTKRYLICFHFNEHSKYKSVLEGKYFSLNFQLKCKYFSLEYRRGQPERQITYYHTKAISEEEIEFWKNRVHPAAWYAADGNPLMIKRLEKLITKKK
jgi:hypothetical protein